MDTIKKQIIINEKLKMEKEGWKLKINKVIIKHPNEDDTWIMKYNPLTKAIIFNTLEIMEGNIKISFIRHEISHALSHDNRDSKVSAQFLEENFKNSHLLDNKYEPNFEEHFAYWVQINYMFVSSKEYKIWENKIIKEVKKIAKNLKKLEKNK